MDATITESLTVSKIRKSYPESILEVYPSKDDDAILIKKENIIAILTLLRDDKELDYNMLMDVGVVDYLKYPIRKRERFEVFYQMYSLTKLHRIRIKCPVSIKEPTIDSANDLWKSANWGEREAFDQFGIKFNNHPNLKRILNHHEFVGHPLRKDYPTKK
ncbi:MAG: NADH-quinone oxidoreductase subunit C, partial [Candidatus Sericytochromatia bacterium]|nr:NADH-quinone oxidoreductase subunit C [Candidatus Sericytochromatia bacterium]